MIKGSNKHYIFDINKIMQQQDRVLNTPSTKAFQHQQILKQRNYQSDTIKESLMQTSANNHNTYKTQNKDLMTKQSAFVKPASQQSQPQSSLFVQSKSQVEIPKPSVYSNNYTNKPPIDSSQKQMINRMTQSSIQDGYRQYTISSKGASMYDFRKNSASSSHSTMIRNNYDNSRQHNQMQYQKQQQSSHGLSLPMNNNQFKPLTPIKESDNAQLVEYVPPSRSIADPDNNILFLDNGNRIINPTNVKTPPPPMWGEVLEEENYDPSEEFYNHQKAEQEMKRRKQMEEKKQRANSKKKLKRKVIYVYESDSDEEKDDNEINQRNELVKSSGATSHLPYQNHSERMKRYYQPASKRGYSTDAYIPKSMGQFVNNTKLPTILGQSSMKNKPPLPHSQQKLQSLPSSNLPSRQIRTGAFQRLPSIGLQIVQKQL